VFEWNISKSLEKYTCFKNKLTFFVSTPLGFDWTSLSSLMGTAARLWRCSSINSWVRFNISSLNSFSVVTSSSWRRRFASANRVANVRPVSSPFLVLFCFYLKLAIHFQ
jgi:hypothetical protein